MLLAFGAVIAAMFLSSYETLARLPMGVAATIGFLGPLGLAVAHARRLAHLLWLALALGGVLLLTPELFSSGARSLIGLAWAALSALSWAGFVVLSGRVSKAIPGLRGLAVASLVAALTLVPYAAFEGGVDRLDPAAGVAIFLIALTTTILPLALEFSALRRMSPRSYGVLVSTEPAWPHSSARRCSARRWGWARRLGLGWSASPRSAWSSPTAEADHDGDGHGRAAAVRPQDPSRPKDNAKLPLNLRFKGWVANRFRRAVWQNICIVCSGRVGPPARRRHCV